MKSSQWIFIYFFYLLSIEYHFICNKTLDRGICSRKEITTEGDVLFQLNPCRSNQICNLNFGEEIDKCIPKDSVPTLLQGELCNSNSDCISGICDQNQIKRCTAPLKENDLCSSHSECPVGTSCAQYSTYSGDNKCLKLLQENNTEAKCDNYEFGLKCQTNLICNGGICIKPGSLKEGAVTYMPIACNSFYMYKNAADTKFTCVKGPYLLNESNQKIYSKLPVVCEENQKCNYSIIYDKKEVILPPKKCPLSLTNSSISFCHPGIANLGAEIEKFFKYIQQYNGSCHISNPFFCDFYHQSSSLFYDAYVSYKRINQYSQVYNNSECIRIMLNQEYDFALDKTSYSVFPSTKFLQFLILYLCLLCLI